MANCNSCGDNTPSNLCNPCAAYEDFGCINPTTFGCITYVPPKGSSVQTFPCLGFSKTNTGDDLLTKLDAWKCEYDNWKGNVKLNPNDTCPQTLIEKLSASTGIALNVVGTGCNAKLEISATGVTATPADEKVKVSATDTSTGFLFDKMESYECITWVKSNIGINERVRPVVDWNCAFTKLMALPAFCTAVNQCIALPPQCGQISNLSIINLTATQMSIDWVGGINNTTFNVALYLDANLATIVPSSIQNNLATSSATFTGLTPLTNYYIKVQALCSNGGTIAPLTLGPISTTAAATPGCPSVTFNSPIVIDNTATVSWISSGTSFNVYLNNVLISTPTQPQSASNVVLTGLSNGNYTIRVEAGPCAGIAQSYSTNFIINYTPACIAPSDVSLSGNTISNTCPSNTVNLNSLITSVPSGTSVEWYTNGSRTSPVPDPLAYNGSSNPVYVFTKNNLTNCYSIGLAVNVSITNCVLLPNLSLNCASNVSIQSGDFVIGNVSNGVINLPINVSSGSGNVSVSVSGGGFSNNGAFNQNVNGLITSLAIPVTFDGTGSVGNRSVTFSVTGGFISPVQCVYTIPVDCPPCNLISTNIVIDNITTSGFDVNVNGLVNTASCVDTYSIVISELTTNTLVTSATNQVSSPFIFNGGVNDTNYIVEVTKNCCCGNKSSNVVKYQTTASAPTFIGETATINNTPVGNSIVDVTYNGIAYPLMDRVSPGSTGEHAVQYFIGNNTVSANITKVIPAPLVLSFWVNNVAIQSINVPNSGAYTFSMNIPNSLGQPYSLRLNEL